MTNHDPLRGAFEDLRRAVSPLIVAPGVAKAHRTIARRRRVRLSVALLVIVTGVLGVAVAPAPTDQDPGKHAPLTSSRTRSGTAPAPSSKPTLSVTPGDVSNAIPSLQASVIGQCQPTAAVRYAKHPNHSGIFTLVWDPVDTNQAQACHGVTVPAFWASYTINASRTETLFKYQRFELSEVDNPSYTGELDLPSGCKSWYIVLGSQPLLDTIDANTNPYPGSYSARPPFSGLCLFTTSTPTHSPD